MKPGRNKFNVRIGPGAREDLTYEGRRYASRAELCYFRDNLKLKALAGDIGDIEHQPRFTLGCPENVYVADFRYRTRAGQIIVADVKGVQTPKFRRDRRLWATYGLCNLEIIVNGKVKETIVPGQPLPRKKRKVRF